MIGRLTALAAAAACMLAATATAIGADRAVNELAKLTDPDGQEWDYFGLAVAVDGEVAVVGAPNAAGPGSSGPGRVFVYRYDGSAWVMEARLEPSDAQFVHGFGMAVAIDGETIVIGDYNDFELGNAAGAAYIFAFDGSQWIEEAKLLASDGSSYDNFGYDVAVAGDVVIIGSPEDDDLGNRSGSVYVFRRARGAWEETAKLHASDGQAGYRFGRYVAISGDRFIAGGMQDYGNYGTAGYVFHFDGDSWIEEAILLPEGVIPEDSYGTAVDIDGGLAVVGAYHDDDPGTRAGAAYVFRCDGASWVQETQLFAGDGAEWDYFGRAVAVEGETIIVGADGDEDHGEHTGSAYVFSASQSSEDCNNNGIPDDWEIADLTCWDCNHNGIPDECDIASGEGEDLNGDGILDECWFPGDAGVVPLLQTRTLYVHAVADVPEHYEDEEYDEAPDFGPYDNQLVASAVYGRGEASQESFIDPRDVRASGGVSASGLSGGGFWCSGRGESVYDVALGAGYDELVLLTGDLNADCWSEYGEVGASVYLTMSDADGTVLFDEEVFCGGWESDHIDVHEGFPLQEQAAYTLSIESTASAAQPGCSGGFTIQLTAVGDVDGDWDVDSADLLALLGAWGPNEDHPADFDGDGDVDSADLLALLGNWGP